jgi:hypothetical protein
MVVLIVSLIDHTSEKSIDQNFIYTKNFFLKIAQVLRPLVTDKKMWIWAFLRGYKIVVYLTSSCAILALFGMSGPV